MIGGPLEAQVTTPCRSVLPTLTTKGVPHA